LALTLRAALMVTEQDPVPGPVLGAVPEQAPLQPVNVEPEAAVAVSTTVVEET